MIYSFWREPTFVFVKKVPEYESDEYELMCSVTPDHLVSEIEQYGAGWYFQDDEERWHSLNCFKERVQKIEETISTISINDV